MAGSAMNKADAEALLERVRRGGVGAASGFGADPPLAPMMAPPGGGAPPPPAPAPAAIPAVAPAPTNASTSGQTVGPPGFGANPDDVHQPGGDALLQFQHPDFRTIEQLYRILPDDSWFQPTVGPGNPIQFEIGSFQVPDSNHYWIFDYEFSVFRFSGVDAGDFLQAEDGRFSGVMGFDITINNRRPNNLLYQLDPQPAQIQKQSFITFNPQGGTTNNSAFNRSTAQSFAATASQGTSVLPVRRQVQGAAGVPFTLVAREQDQVSLSVIIFKRVKTPIAAIQARHAGYLLQSTQSQALQLRMRPR